MIGARARWSVTCVEKSYGLRVRLSQEEAERSSSRRNAAAAATRITLRFAC